MTNRARPIKYCPCCNQSLLLPNSLIVEYWNAKDTIFFCWCSECYWKGEIKGIDRVTTTEVDE